MNVTAMAAETTATVEETAIATEEITTVVVEETTEVVEETTTVASEVTTQELMPMMARGCYDYNDCMSDISSINGFDYSSCGMGYSCSGNYSVAINNSHNYLSVILSYNGSCIGIYM